MCLSSTECLVDNASFVVVQHAKRIELPGVVVQLRCLCAVVIAFGMCKVGMCKLELFVVVFVVMVAVRWPHQVFSLSSCQLSLMGCKATHPYRHDQRCVHSCPLQRIEFVLLLLRKCLSANETNSLAQKALWVWDSSAFTSTRDLPTCVALLHASAQL